jgi:CDP-diacylglycerol--glycerol-3-phosphate 3-phosphatidyltransferase
MNLPTTLTVLRIFIVPLLVVLMLTKEENMDLWAAGIFLGAAVSDALDGYLARKHGQITTLGILLDPIADKLLTSAAFISLVELGRVPAWMVAIVIGREFAVSGLRAIASSKGIAIAASDLGKAKMVFQVMAIIALVLERRFPVLEAPGEFLMWVVVIFALASGLQYFWGFWRKVDLRARPQPGQPMVVLRIDEKEDEKDVPAQ